MQSEILEQHLSVPKQYLTLSAHQKASETRVLFKEVILSNKR